jgi:predicted phage terminase large subunit-like protein
MTVSETFPSYFIGRDPSRRVITVCYGDALARKFGRANRRKIEEFGKDLFGVSVSSENASMNNWGIQGHDGGMISAGVGGPITGEGADLLIIDDPIKNREEAESVTYREKVWDEWQNTLLTRLHPGGAVIIIMTRWHQDDFVGRLLSLEPDIWTVVSLPAEAEENDPLGRPVGAPLWPEHGFNAEWMSVTKEAVGTRAWTSLYQQKPSPQEGSILKRHWWQYWCYPGQKLPPVIVRDEFGEFVSIEAVPLPKQMELAQSWDMAFKDTRASAYVAGQVWGKEGANKYLLDQIRDKLDFVRTLQAVITLSVKWPQARAKWIEDKANGPAVMSVLKSKLSGLIPIQPHGTKEARAYAVTPQIQSGNVYLPHPHLAPWVEGFIEECAMFPNGAYADQVDTATQALNEFGKAPEIKAFNKRLLGL